LPFIHTCVAITTFFAHSSAQLSLQLLTGTINAHMWVENSNEADNIVVNQYAHVFRKIRHQNDDTKSILIAKIQPVSGVNEVSTHYMEVVNARYQAEEYYKNGGGPGGSKKT
jgi:replication factor A2